MRYVNSVGIIRKLAKTSKFQTIYNCAKEVGLKLFRNECEYTEIQLLFLNFLNLYATIHLDIALGEIDDLVLDNEIYEDSYLYWRRKSRNEKKENQNNPMNNNYDDAKNPRYTQSKTSTWVFKTPPKEVK